MIGRCTVPGMGHRGGRAILALIAAAVTFVCTGTAVDGAVGVLIGAGLALAAGAILWNLTKPRS